MWCPLPSEHRQMEIDLLQLWLLLTELKAQSTMQIESDLFLSAVLTGRLAQLETAEIVITKSQGLLV